MIAKPNHKRWIFPGALGCLTPLLCILGAWFYFIGWDQIFSQVTRPPAAAPQPRITISAQNVGKLEPLYQITITDTVKVNEAINVVNVLAWSPDSRWLAMGSEGGIGIPSQGSLQLWDVVEGHGRVLYSHEQSAFGSHALVAFLPDGQTLAYQTGTSITFWDAPHDRELRTQQYTSQDGVNAAFFLAATGHGFPNMTITRRVAYVWPRYANDPESYVFSPDGKIVFVNLPDVDSGLVLRDVTSGDVVETITGDLPALFSHNGRMIVSTDRTYHEIYDTSLMYQDPLILSDVESGQVLQRLVGDVPTPPRSFIAFSPDDTLVASPAAVGWNSLGHFLPRRQFYVWDTHSGKRYELNAAHGDGEAVAFSPDARFLATGWSDGTVQLWGIRP